MESMKSIEMNSLETIKRTMKDIYQYKVLPVVVNRFYVKIRRKGRAGFICSCREIYRRKLY